MEIFFAFIVIIFNLRCKKEISQETGAKKIKEKDLETKNLENLDIKTNTKENNQVIWDEAPIDMVDECKKNKNIDFSMYSTIPENLHPKWKIYGSKKRAIFCASFPFYLVDNLNIKSILLCDENGKFFIQRGIDSILDFSKKGSIKSIIFDGVYLMESQYLWLVFFSSSGQGYLWKNLEKISFLDTFQNLPVIEESICHLPFSPISEQVIFSDQPFYAIQTKNQIENNFSFKESFITDPSGQIISQIGQEFKNIFEYPFFVSYQPKDQSYKRTIYWIG